MPVTGAQDSYFTVWFVKHKLNMNPLLVHYNSHWNSPLGISNLANLRIKSNSDLIQLNVSATTVRKITKLTLAKFGNVYWHVLAGQSVHPVNVAIRKKVPLIIWGAHQGTEQVGMFLHEHEVEMSRHYRKMHDLFSVEADDLTTPETLLTEDDIHPYRYPSDEKIAAAGVRGIYLSNFVPWDPKMQHEFMVRTWNYKSARSARTFDTYDYVDSLVYLFVHDWLKLLKHGYSKVTDHATREVRFGRLTRDIALEAVRRYEQQKPQNLEAFSSWLGIGQEALDWVLSLHANPRYWQGLYGGPPSFRGWSTIENERRDNWSPSELNSLESSFIATSQVSEEDLFAFVTIGRGFPDHL